MNRGIFSRIKRHIAVAGGDFASMFKDVEVPPLPMAVSRLLAEINRPEPDIDQLVKLISSSTGLAAKVIKTVNSSLFSLRTPVTNVKHATTLLGLRHIRSLALAYATMEALPRPEGDLFNHEAFWTDSLLQAMLSRSLSSKKLADQREEAFTASLLADVALPVLLCCWQDYYQPVVEEWRQSPERLSEIERRHFGWDHAQAGAWILQSWEFPQEMVCFIGAHNLSWEQIQEHELTNTLVTPLAVAALTPSVLKTDPRAAQDACEAACKWLELTPAEFAECVGEVRESFREVLDLFDLPDQDAGRILNALVAAAGAKE
jgi:HD-like signal output (HDOD) protein